MEEDIPPIPDDFFSKASVEIALMSASYVPISASLELDPCPLPSLPCPSSPSSPSPAPLYPADLSDHLPRRNFRRCPLSHFTRKTGRRPKQEYFIAMLVRGLRKAIRRTAKGGDCGPCCGLFAVLRDEERTAWKWQRFQHKVRPLLGFIDTECLATEAHPSFNKQYIRHFYDSPYVRVAHFYFIDLIFSASPDLLATALKIHCCEGAHSETCERLWERLRDYADWWMLKEVGLDPFREI